MIVRGLIVFGCVSLGLAVPVQATSGWGCFRVINVAANDDLNLRLRPSARSTIVDRLIPGRHGIIAEDGGCTPSGARPSKQWCPVKHFNGDQTIRGWARMVFLAPSQCP